MATTLPRPEYLPDVSLRERIDVGKQLRREVPHELHASWSPSDARPDPISLLEHQAESRLPELVPLRHGRMASSAFSNYRGAAAAMAFDLAGTPTAGLHAQLCGDAHLLNFGIFSCPERTLMFGINDFDETLPGPIEWDVKRLAASVEVAARDLGFADQDRESAVVATARAYREAMIAFAEERELDLWYARLPSKKLRARLSADAKEVKREERKGEHKDHLRAFDRLIARNGDDPRFVSQPPLLVPIEELLDDEQLGRFADISREFLTQYRGSLQDHTRAMMERYRYVHIARKVVGVGSVGTRCWVILMLGRDQNDPLILQLKEAQRSVLEEHTAPSVYASQGRRVVEGQRFMQTRPDFLLGWYRLTGFDGHERDFYVRQLWDGKASIDVNRLSPDGLAAYGEACGWTLARGHARSGDRIAMAAYLGKKDTFERAIAEFANRYADTNDEDHSRLLSAIAEGRVEAVSEDDA
jgi:uncharacterized protein (DUF2252 family)